ncbi:Nitric oxide reductase FlRd-NAD(+) reductase [Candidatus Methylobacter favarea]|uniref:Nitric oxide reductase FlRd-NAD(+) reductase n=1 Tax=Candidatus Methylobacter favarea TaxID=2707345 RepID=A0A8S0XJH4_9GAMM|nr:FAD-dependent oxidoreductase [Candidatus Methylobacter favarea]CAA9891388.1 Nitric oxide reductase FlRd-NAD(+) reductase [Candidatus Methylobacter favarea]
MDTVIIGSGIAGVSFAEKYRLLTPAAKITLITRENDGYYSRPLLSRGFSKNDIEQSIILKPFDKLRENGIHIVISAEATSINRKNQTVAVAGSGQEQSLPYDKLVISQGSAAFIPPPFKPYNQLFFCLNSLADLKALRRFRQGFLNENRNPDWAIVGGGLIGCEVASDLAVAGDSVTLFHAMDRLMERQLAAEDSALLLKVLTDSGIKVLLNQNVQGFAKQEEKVCVKTDVSTGFDGVIVACGFKPRTGLAEKAGLETGRGIKVNQYLQTTDNNIYAVGDIAELPNGKLYAYILPIRSQAFWLAGFMAGQEQNEWSPPVFTTKAKVHGFEAVHPYTL